MKPIKNLGKPFLLLSAFCLLFPRYSHAYIDPGTGSYVFQIIIAAFVAVAFAVKVYWQKIKIFVVRIFSKKEK
ncbi:MAG: hypothetical protein L6428_01570 [Candidatus Aminicenantes bacterium]|nr:hypothetical protein [Candidatus Aminicenantes bacterium]